MNKPYFKQLIIFTFLVSPTSVFAFTDINIQDEFYPATTYLEQHSIFKGYDDGSFGRDKLINRAESLKIILIAAEIEAEEATETKFADVPKDIWFAPFINHAATLGIVSGDSTTGNFAPGRTVNKAEFIKMLMLSFEIDPTQYELGEVPISDVPDDIWFAPYLKFAVKYKIVTPDQDNNIHPGKELTRGEAADLIFSMLRQGKGLNPQTLLNLAEIHLIKSIEFIEKQEIGTAAVLVSIAEKFSTYALELLPQNSIVLSADKVVKALKNITGAYIAGSEGRIEEVIATSKQAWNLADESFNLNDKNQTLTDKIKTIASQIATKAREQSGQ